MVRLLLGSLHCHSTLSDGSLTPEEILAKAAAAGLDFVAITDHVPPGAADVPTGGAVTRRATAEKVPPDLAAVDPAAEAGKPGPSAAPGAAWPPRAPLLYRGVVRVPGFEFSPPRSHYLVLGLDPQEAPDPTRAPGWPEPGSYIGLVAGRPGVFGFLAHPDDPGNSFLKVKSYAWGDWSVGGYAGLEVWNLATEWSRTIRSYADAVRAEVAGIYRAVPPPNPVTLARWDRLAQRRPVAGIAGTDAHAYPTRWHGLKLVVLPYLRAFGTLQTAVWADRETAEDPRVQSELRAKAIVEALGRGRSFMVNRALGHPSGFVFQAQEAGGEALYGPGDSIPRGCPVRFEVATPVPAWIRLVRNGVAVANTYARELTFEPLPEPAGTQSVLAGPQSEAARPRTSLAGIPPDPAWTPLDAGDRAVQEAWRAEVWVHSPHWSRAGTGFYLWILTNFVYRRL